MTLPTAILVHICNLLHDSHIASLEAFSLGNKHCYKIAATVLAHTITFRIRTAAQLSEDVDKCKKLLGRYPPGLFQHVRRLVIVGRMHRPNLEGCDPLPTWEDTIVDLNISESEDNMDDDDKPVARKTKANKPTFHFSLPTTTDWNIMHAQLHGFQFESEHGRSTIPLRPRPDGLVHLHVGDDDNPDDACALSAEESNERWLPLADLISRLPGLVDVVYRCPSQFPPCLLKTMHAREKPLPRLPLQLFKVRSAYDNSVTIDPHEQKIMTSPCLYSIQYKENTAWNREQRLSPQLDAVVWMLRQAPMSPHLKEVNVVGRTWRGAPENSRRHPISPEKRLTFFRRGQQELGALDVASGKGRLTHLRFDSGVGEPRYKSRFGPGGGNWIEKWDTVTDFSLLRTLALVQPVSQAQVIALQWTSLPELTALSLTCEMPASMERDAGCARSDHFQTITTFLASLTSLRTLQVIAWDHAQHLFSFGSPKLEKLALVPIDRRDCFFACLVQNFLTLEGLATLASSFPRLTDLSIPVKRSRGGSAEVALYRYIGEHMRYLRRLTLSLDCSPPGFIVTDQSDHDTPLPEPYPSGPRWPAVGAALNSDKDQYVQAVKNYRNGHIYDIFINAALDASLARKIFDAVVGT
ncbi:hypothetical protein CHGG_04154 [Chaetomium globosum CBS 148.51]|uniref:Uncharacterized protein n=1 Tax=Chaetomium globosum (strain ATCC 6205 / CBS 148.51 / DSM 1962 / NBRC 6347 / NRRL 1970) TaxID=306901 RepID=Q2H242_CHAGB|nr:uncharacterized protein CHGG_04154 [Chaetomium globosum CBS 148.51]EAQ87535.1 hypothetical protein CHGG_04154 [Chaetomium globosum CBS 148.51]